MRVKIKNKDFKNATCYTSNTKCPLGVTLRRMFPKKTIVVGAHSVEIGNKVYIIPIKKWGDNNDDIDNMIKEAKKGKKVGPVILKLKRQRYES